ncbi:hypothetical protein RD792_014926 [Penstemon davidsonii]|uniref:RRM domain-containing protein n=1 Tax=Penstemon davidsonii TaxID=160366 RepID=A0ABR0CS74_9LAMI|nr:hypothetical protein RD792_014926 [Penstemon davidsonii]
MAFFRKAANILGRTVSNHVSDELTLSRLSIFQAIRCMSTSKLFIGGLSYSTDDTSLMEAFNKYGDVAEARVIVDRDTGRSRGFGFVTYSSVEEASSAIQALDQQELHGRRIRVDYANDRTRGYSGGASFGGGGDGGFGGNYGGTGGGYNSGGNYEGGGGGYGNSSNGGNLSYGDSRNLGGGNNSFSGGSDGFGDKFGSAENKSSQDEPLEGSYRDDDDTPDNYADRRA